MSFSNEHLLADVHIDKNLFDYHQLLLFFIFSINFRYYLYVRSGRRKKKRQNGYQKKFHLRLKFTSVPGTILLVHVTSCDVISGIEETSSTLTVPIKLRFVDRPKS